MPIIDFPFLKMSPNSIRRPMLFIKITNPHTGQKIDTAGIIDTGADACAVPAVYADMLGYSVKDGIPKPVGTGGGLTTAYTHTCRIDIYNTIALQKGNTEAIYTTSEAQIDFMEQLPVVLLGVSDFLGQFFLGIDYPSQLFSVRYC
jgi:hypothetical protein